MGLDKKSKKKVWKCPNGCNVEKLKRPCEHLEKLLMENPEEPQFESVNRRIDIPTDNYYSSGAGFVIPEGIKSGRYEAQFRKKLSKFGLSNIQIEILVSTFIYSETLKETSDGLNIPSLSTVLRLKSDALKILKSKGFGR